MQLSLHFCPRAGGRTSSAVPRVRETITPGNSLWPPATTNPFTLPFTELLLYTRVLLPWLHTVSQASTFTLTHLSSKLTVPHAPLPAPPRTELTLFVVTFPRLPCGLVSLAAVLELTKKTWPSPSAKWCTILESACHSTVSYDHGYNVTLLSLAWKCDYRCWTAQFSHMCRLGRTPNLSYCSLCCRLVAITDLMSSRVLRKR